MIIPELPAYLSSMGGGEYKGLIIALFTVTAGLSRPLSGKLADKIGRVPVMIIGAVVSGIAALIYPVVSGVIGFFLLRLFHGFSTGFKPTGTSAYVADIIPLNRRGEAMGYLGFFSSLGMASGPAIGSYIATNYSLLHMFYSSSAFAILSVAILIGMKESLKERERLSLEHFVIKRKEFFEPRVMAPSIVMMLSVYAFGTILTVVPDLSDSLDLTNRGMFFTYFTMASLIVRLLAGRASDKFGRVGVIKIGCVILVVGLLLIAHVNSEILFVSSAILFGLGVGVVSPTIFAWTIDLSDEKHRGRGIATMYIALEIGIGLGAFLSGWVYSNELENLKAVFYLAAICQLAAFIFLYSRYSKNVLPMPS
jgi:MFS family permease